MQKAIYLWLFFIASLMLPIGSAGKIDSKRALIAPSTNPVFAKDRRHFPTANPLDRVRMPKIFRKFIEKRLYTEGSSEKTVKPKSTIWGRIFTVLVIAIAAVLIVFYLQGTIGLSLATLVIFGYWRNRKKIADWENGRYARKNGYTVGKSGEKIYNNAPSSINNPVNKLTNRAIKRFLWGIGLIFSTFLIALSTIFIDVAVVTGLALIFAFLVGFGFTVVSVVNAFQAINAKEPQSSLAWIVILLGIPLILVFFNILLAISSL